MRREPDVIRVYSHSFLAAVQPSGQLRAYLADVEAFRRWYMGQARLRTFLEGPHIREQDKLALVEAVFGKGRLPPLLLNLLRVVIAKKRILMLPEILEEFRKIGEEAIGQVVGRVTTAIPVDPPKQRLLAQKLEMVTGQKFVLDFRVDKDVLGGVLVQYKDVIIDGTLRGRLRGLRARLESVAA